MRDKLLGTITSVVELLAACGEQARADWFRERLAVLESERLESNTFQDVVCELRDILVGMGSLSDLSLNPTPSSGLTKQEARNQQWELVEDLDEAIRGLLADMD